MSQSDFYRGVACATAALATRRESADSPADRAAAVHTAMAELFATTTLGADRACRRGCAHCCHLPVGVTFGEALLLATAIGERPELRAAVTTAAQLTGETPWHQLVGRACPLLRDGACTVHAARPLPCRALASADAALCAAGLAGTANVPVDDESFFRGLGAADALAVAEVATGTRELRSAVHAVLLAAPAEMASAFLAARAVGDPPGDGLAPR